MEFEAVVMGDFETRPVVRLQTVRESKQPGCFQSERFRGRRLHWSLFGSERSEQEV